MDDEDGGPLDYGIEALLSMMEEEDDVGKAQCRRDADEGAEAEDDAFAPSREDETPTKHIGEGVVGTEGGVDRGVMR